VAEVEVGCVQCEMMQKSKKQIKKNKDWGSGRVGLGYKVGSLKSGVICVACLIVVVVA